VLYEKNEEDNKEVVFLNILSEKKQKKKTPLKERILRIIPYLRGNT
jgi:hypothetical protein